MKTRLVLCYLFVWTAAGSAQEKTPKFTLTPTINWNQEELDWNIAGDENGKNPTILSELKWRKLRGPEIGLSSTLALSSVFQLAASVHHFRIGQGRGNDSDYAGDNRTLKTADFDFLADQGHTTRIRAEVFYRVWTRETCGLTVHTGYFGRYQTLYMLDAEVPLVEGKILKSSYKPRWHGLILGFDAAYSIHVWNFSLGVSGLYFPSYSANANWNLQEDFRHPLSFTHKASGMGWEGNLRVGQQLTKIISPFLQVDYTGLSTGTGTDQLFKADGTSPRSQLNAVRSTSFRLGAGIQLKF